MHAVTSLEVLPGRDAARPRDDTGGDAVIPAKQGHTTLLIVDHDHARCDILAANFEADGYAVLTASTVPAAAGLLLRCRISVLVIEGTLVHGPGSVVLTDIRSGPSYVANLAGATGGAGGGERPPTHEPTKLWEHGQLLDPDLPIIVTATRRDDLACIRALDAGSDDYLAAPFTYMELRARVRALLRRQTRGSHRARLAVGPLEIDAVSRQAWVSGARLRLSAKEFSLLYSLATEPTRLFTRAELLRIVWGLGPSFENLPHATTRTLDSHASRLRRKLRAAGVEYVINVWGAGYKLCDAQSLEESVTAPALTVVDVLELPRAG